MRHTMVYHPQSAQRVLTHFLTGLNLYDYSVYMSPHGGLEVNWCSEPGGEWQTFHVEEYRWTTNPEQEIMALQTLILMLN